MIYQEKPSTLT